MPVKLFFERYRIQSQQPDLLLLQSIAGGFSHLPYENVTKILKHAGASQSTAKLRLMDEVLLDHLRWNTGGTCFSLCNALQNILTASGFNSFIAMADMHYGRNIHCTVITILEGRKYLTDPGYLLHDPILLPEEMLETTRLTPMNTVSIKNEAPDVFSVYTIEGKQRKWRYRLRANQIAREEFESHWIHSFSLNSMEHVTLSRVDSKGRLYYRKNRLDLVSPSERSKQRIEESGTETLARCFQIPADLLSLAHKAVSGRS